MTDPDSSPAPATATEQAGQPGQPRQLEHPRQPGQPDRPWIVPAAIVTVAAVLIAGVLYLNPGYDSTETATGQASGQAASDGGTSGLPAQGLGAIEHPSALAVPDLSAQESRDPDDLLAEGPVDAPVVLVVFTDFQCPYCARWSDETLPELRQYVERGQLRIEWRDVNIYGEDSERASRAVLAAAMQGKHTEYHDALFEGGQIRSERELGEEALIALAGDLGLDTERFRTDMDSDQVTATVAANAQQGREVGAVSTPSFVIGGTPLVGAQPTAVFTTAVDAALDRADG